MILAVEDDGFEDIVNYDTADELDLDDYDDVKKMLDKDDNVENKYLILDKIHIVEKLLLDKDYHIVETGKQKDFDHSEDDFEDAEDPFALQFADLVQNQKQDLED